MEIRGISNAVKATRDFAGRVGDFLGIKDDEEHIASVNNIISRYRAEVAEIESGTASAEDESLGSRVGSWLGFGDDEDDAAPADSLFTPPPAANAHVTVDFTNMPRGTRTETRADSDTDLEVTTGYAMQGAQ